MGISSIKQANYSLFSLVHLCLEEILTMVGSGEERINKPAAGCRASHYYGGASAQASLRWSPTPHGRPRPAAD